MASVRPLGDRVLVRVAQREGMTTGGVVLPDNVRQESDRGLVIAVGPGEHDEAGELRPVPVEAGEVVVFSPYAGSKVAVGHDDFLLLRPHDILGVLEGVVASDEDGAVRLRETAPA